VFRSWQLNKSIYSSARLFDSPISDPAYGLNDHRIKETDLMLFAEQAECLLAILQP